jgi:hypothetical protein
LTLTANLAAPALPLESVASHVTKVRPIGKRAPDRGAHATRTCPSTASIAVTL